MLRNLLLRHLLLTIISTCCFGYAAQLVQAAPDTPGKQGLVESNSTVALEATTKDVVKAGTKTEKATSESKAEDAEESSTEKKSSSEEEKSEADKEKAEEKEADKEPEPFKVEKKPLTIEVKLDGSFVADKMEEVELRPEVWTKFKVLEAVKHGAQVSKGDVLVRFDPEDLEKDLSKESIDQRIAELTLMEAEENYPRSKRLAEIRFENAKRSFSQTEEDYEYYKTTDRPFFVEIAKYRLKSSQEQLAAAKEELEQLQQMYEADELTEATEEIVLRRQKFAVETAKLMLRLNTEDHDHMLNVILPRRDESYRTAMEESELRFKQAQTAFDTGLHKQVYEMEKRRQTRSRSVERHAKLVADKSLMTLRAPVDGVVYYGRCLDGKWSEVSSMKNKLKPNGTASAKSVLMTIVQPRPLHILSSFGEKMLPEMKEGLKTTISPVADEELEFTAKVAKFDTVPGKSNKFEIQFELDSSELPEWLVAGMTCKANVETYHNPDALQIPLDMVQTDEDDEELKYVMLVEEAKEEPVRKRVKLGHEKDKMVEVLEGLEEGDEIVKEEKKEDA